MVLKPVLDFQGVPYQDNESTGTDLNESGRDLERNVNAALRTSHHVLPLLDGEFTAIAAELQATNLRSATELRLVMISGLVIALALVVLVTVLLSARQRQESSLRQARQQTADILRTVKDGLFLLDQNLIIGAAYSGALETLFQRKDFAGLPFESLLKSIVSEKTLATALKFVKILWAERTNEKLVKTINPLGEVEVHLDGGNGKFDTRYPAVRFPPSARRRGDDPRAGVGVGCDCPGGSGATNCRPRKARRKDRSIPCWAFCTSIRRS